MGKIKLFCLPYAGGSANIYMEWKKYLHPLIELNAIELAGRGPRSEVPFYKSVDEAVSDIYNRIKDDLNNCRYVIFGHSMGSVLAYELAYKIKSLQHLPPLHLFFSGRHAPQIKKDKKNLHVLPDNEFMREVIELGGTPKELLENRELLEIFLPILRADFQIVETYNYIEKNEKLDCDITILWGKQEEETTISDISLWRGHTNKSCRIHLLNGGHFFINEFMQDVVSIINSEILSLSQYNFK